MSVRGARGATPPLLPLAKPDAEGLDDARDLISGHHYLRRGGGAGHNVPAGKARTLIENTFKGYLPGGKGSVLDGEGQVTEEGSAAIREFQRRAHIRVDGIIGPETLNAMVEGDHAAFTREAEGWYTNRTHSIASSQYHSGTGQAFEGDILALRDDIKNKNPNARIFDARGNRVDLTADNDVTKLLRKAADRIEGTTGTPGPLTDKNVRAYNDILVALGFSGSRNPSTIDQQGARFLLDYAFRPHGH